MAAVPAPDTPGGANFLRWLQFRVSGSTFECPSVYQLVKPIGKGGARRRWRRCRGRVGGFGCWPVAAARGVQMSLGCSGPRGAARCAPPHAALLRSRFSLWHRVRRHRLSHQPAGRRLAAAQRGTGARGRRARAGRGEAGQGLHTGTRDWTDAASSLLLPPSRSSSQQVAIKKIGDIFANPLDARRTLREIQARRRRRGGAGGCWAGWG